jgi:hypothetical protein
LPVLILPLPVPLPASFPLPGFKSRAFPAGDLSGDLWFGSLKSIFLPGFGCRDFELLGLLLHNSEASHFAVGGDQIGPER